MSEHWRNTYDSWKTTDPRDAEAEHRPRRGCPCEPCDTFWAEAYREAAEGAYGEDAEAGLADLEASR